MPACILFVNFIRDVNKGGGRKMEGMEGERVGTCRGVYPRGESNLPHFFKFGVDIGYQYCVIQGNSRQQTLPQVPHSDDLDQTLVV